MVLRAARVTSAVTEMEGCLVTDANAWGRSESPAGSRGRSCVQRDWKSAGARGYEHNRIQKLSVAHEKET